MDRSMPYLLIAFIGMIVVVYLMFADRRRARMQRLKVKKLYSSPLFEVMRPMLRQAQKYSIESLTIDKTVDVNETGMIGSRWSGMTTTLGVLEAKRTSTQPDFAAVIVSLLRQCGVKPGDRVAINLSGSFPALGLSALSAAQVLELRPVLIASLGASMWGANDPAFTWLDMEQTVRANSLIRSGTAAASLGGAHDVGKDMDDAVRDQLRARIRAAGITFIDEPDFAKNLAIRMERYLADGLPACFINIGGNLASGGAEADTGALRPGLIRSTEEAGTRIGGLMHEFLARKVPVIHLLDLKSLAISAGLPYDPVPLPPPGSSGVFRATQYYRGYIAVLLALAAGLLAAYVRLGKR